MNQTSDHRNAAGDAALGGAPGHIPGDTPRDTPSDIPGDAPGEARRNVEANLQWGGRFAAGPSAVMQEINASIGFDRKLWRQDIRGSLRACGDAGEDRASSAGR